MELDGQLLRPGDPGYDDAGRVWNAMVDRRPGVIVRCASVQRCPAAVGPPFEHGLEIGVRCGGQASRALVPDGGMTIDLTPLGSRSSGPRCSPGVGSGRRAARRARPGCPGARARDHGWQRLSHRVPAGSRLAAGWDGSRGIRPRSATTSCPLRSSPPRAKWSALSEEENPELYWGLRGGGGNLETDRVRVPAAFRRHAGAQRRTRLPGRPCARRAD